MQESVMFVRCRTEQDQRLHQQVKEAAEEAGKTVNRFVLDVLQAYMRKQQIVSWS